MYVIFFVYLCIESKKITIMGRLTEAVYLLNCDSSRYSKRREETNFLGSKDLHKLNTVRKRIKRELKANNVNSI